MYKYGIAITCVLLAFLGHAQEVGPQTKPSQPNIVLVLLDDVGFMDLGVYGSDTATPNIDEIAKAGIQLTRYYTTPLCGPSRASLMTGQTPHQVGTATLKEVLTDQMRTLPAYSMKWREDQKTLASRLKEVGYQTFVSGKWGIGEIGSNLPHRFGFDRSWVLDSTGSSNYRAKSYLPHYLDVEWYEDGKRTTLPKDFYSSRNIIDKMIQYVDEADPNKPYFGYLSFQAIHIPIQVSREYIDKYDGVFDKGWDYMRKERLEKAIELGLVPESTQLSNIANNHRPWSSLNDKEKAYWARVMQVNAGMMESADYHFGRLVEHIKAKGQLENTIFIVTSDNGPEWNTLGKTSPPAVRAFENFWMFIEGWDVNYENLGQVGSLAAIGREWASVSAAPFHLFKFNASEGGMRVPLVISGPGIENRGLLDMRTQVADITPTILDLASVNFSPEEFYGRSLLPALNGDIDSVYTDNESFVFETSGTAALYRGSWKLTKTPEPFGDGHWHLYDINKDPGETYDLADEKPELFQDMVTEYETYANNAGVFKLAPGESSRKQLVKNAIKGTLKNYWYIFVGILGVLILGLYGVFRFTKIAVKRTRNIT